MMVVINRFKGNEQSRGEERRAHTRSIDPQIKGMHLIPSMARRILLLLLAAAFLSPGEAQTGGPPYYGGGDMGMGAGGGMMPSMMNCSEMTCGAGSCNSSYSSSRNGSSYSYSYNYTGSLCECRQGWMPAFSTSQSTTPYRPCVWPNCNITMEGCNATTIKQPQPPTNTTITDPCAWADCGWGDCESESQSKYRCKCKSGFANLFNNTAFPCLNECMLSQQCKSVGASFSASALADAGGGGKNGTGGSTSGTAGAPAMLLGFFLVALSLAIA